MFLSDNTAPASPEILNYIQQHLQESTDLPYGGDRLTEKLNACVSEIFERSVHVFPVLSGTASNCLALAAMCPSTGGAITHRNSHISVDENTAPHFFTGGAALHQIGEGTDTISPEELSRFCAKRPWRDVHSAVPRVLTLTQATELGRVYSTEHLQELGEVANHYNMRVFIDGARFANALVKQNLSPSDAVMPSGVSAMTLGAIKNGTFGAEALVLFDTDLFPAVRQKAKQTGHLASKMRYLSAQLLAYFDQDLWLNNARAANTAAQRLCTLLNASPHCSLTLECETNQIFVSMPDALHKHLENAGFEIYPWHVEDQACFRLVTNWATSDAHIEAFADAINTY
ncbi:MAG: low specificity L-threonine aldolase [Pseudomonadales bacterium]